MLWRGERQSGNIEDRPGMRVGTGLVGGGLGGLVLLLISLYFGMTPGADVNPDTPVNANGPASTSPADQDTKEFIATVVGYTEDTWSDLFQQSGKTYRAPNLCYSPERQNPRAVSLSRRRVRSTARATREYTWT